MAAKRIFNKTTGAVSFQLQFNREQLNILLEGAKRMRSLATSGSTEWYVWDQVVGDCLWLQRKDREESSKPTVTFRRGVPVEHPGKERS